MEVRSGRTELNWTELTCNKLTQLHGALLVACVSVTKLIGCTTDHAIRVAVGRNVTRRLNSSNSPFIFIHRPCSEKILAIKHQNDQERNKVSPRGRRDDMLPPMTVRSKNRSGSTSVRGRVRSPHISGGRRWLRCGQPACHSLRSCVMGQPDGRIALFQNAP